LEVAREARRGVAGGSASPATGALGVVRFAIWIFSEKTDYDAPHPRRHCSIESGSTAGRKRNMRNPPCLLIR
jgi:hypothetical protein